MDDLLTQAKAAIKAGEKTRARKLLSQALPDNRKNPEFWLLLAQADVTNEERYKCYRNVLRFDPENQEAKWYMAANLNKGFVEPPESTKPPSKAPKKKPPKKKIKHSPLSLALTILGLCIVVTTCGSIVFGMISGLGSDSASSNGASEAMTTGESTTREAVATPDSWPIQITTDEFISNFQDVFTWRERYPGTEGAFYQGIGSSGDLGQKFNIWPEPGNQQHIKEVTFSFTYPNYSPESLTNQGLLTAERIIPLVIPEWEGGNDWLRQSYAVLDQREDNLVEVRKGELIVSLDKGRLSETETVVLFTIWRPDEPATIVGLPGLNPADVTLSLKNEGFKCTEAEEHETYYLRACELSQDNYFYTVNIYGESLLTVDYISATALQYDGNLEQAAAFLGFVATAPFDDARPGEAKEWVIQRTSTSESFNTEFAGVPYDLYGNPEGKTLTIGVFRW